MTIRWTPDGKVDRDFAFAHGYPSEWADALDECVAALRTIEHLQQGYESCHRASDALRKLGVEP